MACDVVNGRRLASMVTSTGSGCTMRSPKEVRTSPSVLAGLPSCFCGRAPSSGVSSASCVAVSGSRSVVSHAAGATSRFGPMAGSHHVTSISIKLRATAMLAPLPTRTGGGTALAVTDVLVSRLAVGRRWSILRYEVLASKLLRTESHGRLISTF